MIQCIWNIGKVVMLDSGFYGLKWIVEFSKFEFFVSVLIKKVDTGQSLSRVKT